jgi:hypothetical protein
MTSPLLVLLAFSWSTLLIASTKHLKCSSDHHFQVSLQGPKLGLPTKGSKPLPKGEVTSLQRTILDTHLKWYCLIDPSDGLNLMESLFKSFSFYLIKSFSFYHMTFKIEYQICTPNTFHNQMALYSLLVMLLDQSKTKLRYLNHM